MTPELWQKVSREFDRAAELDPGQRQAFLELLRQEDSEVGDYVKAMLDQQDRPDAVVSSKISTDLLQHIDVNAETEPHHPPVSEDGPAEVGPYRIDGQLGKGGMGIVLCGQDPDFNRTLAIKVLHAGRKDNADLKRRFLEEAQIMAQLQHPGIPPVHDLGELPDGRPYFAMKQIQGKTLSQILDDHVTESANLDPLFLHIFDQICQTMAYAHASGVIHRDLKPSNIMVGAFGEVQVMDWGLAKEVRGPWSVVRGSEANEVTPEKKTDPDRESVILANQPRTTDQEPLTRSGVVMGTPAYMPPEQARGEIQLLDERTDVFALGSLLCELLTGSPAYQVTEPELDRALEHETDSTDPVLRATTRHKLIFQKSCAGDLDETRARLDRGGDADLIALAKRCLAVQREDRPRSAGEVATAVARFQEQVQERLRQAELQRAQLKIKAVEEGKRLRVERQKRRTSIALAAAVLVLVTGASAVGFWYQRVSYEADRQQVQTEQNIRDALAQAQQSQKSYFRELAEPGGVFKLLNKREQWLGMIRSVKESFERADALRWISPQEIDAGLISEINQLKNTLQRDRNDFDHAVALEKIRMDRSAAVKGQFFFTHAEIEYPKVFEKAELPILNGKLPELAKRVNRSLIKEQLLAALDDWALAAFGNHKPALQQRLLMLARLADPDPLRDRLRDPAVWNDRKKLEQLFVRLQKTNNASLSPQMQYLAAKILAPLNDKTESWLRRAQVSRPDDFLLNFQLGYVLRRVKPDEAAGFYRAALAIRPKSTVAYHNLAGIYFEKMDWKQAEAYYREALKFDAGYASIYTGLGGALVEQKRLPEAVAILKKALKLTHQKAHSDLAHTHYNLGNALYDLQNVSGAEKAFRAAIKYDEQLGAAYAGLGRLLYDRGRLSEAGANARKALSLNLPEAHRRADAHNLLGMVLHAQGKVKKAIVEYRKSIKLNPNSPILHNNLGNSLDVNRDPAGAIAEFHKALDLDPKFAGAWYNLGVTLHETRDFDGALEAYRKAVKFDPKSATAHTNMGMILFDRNDVSGAIKAYRLGISQNPKVWQAWNGLGRALEKQRDLPGAKNAFENTIKLIPQAPLPHCNLAFVLRSQGDFAAALASFRRGHQLSSKQSGSKLPTARWIAECENLLHLDHRLQAISEGKASAAKADEQLALAKFCKEHKKRYHAAARFFQSAFSASPKLAENPVGDNRYWAACAAALAAAGKGTDAGNLTQKEKELLRRQSLEWLTADLSLWRKRLEEGNPKTILHVEEQVMPHWQKDPDLGSIRAANELAKLSESEQENCRRLWKDVDKLLKEAKSSGIISTLKGMLTDKKREKVHSVKMTAGNFYVIDLISSQFDSFLRLENAKGKLLDENDDKVPGRILHSRLKVVPKRGGEYRLIATSFRQQGQGDYFLRIREFTTPGTGGTSRRRS